MARTPETAVLRGAAFALVVALGCGSRPTGPELVTVPVTGDELSPAERAAVRALSPLPAPPLDPTNAYAAEPRAVALGQMLFFDEDLSGPMLVDSPLGQRGERGKLSCRTCHAGPALDDRQSQPGHISIGTGVTGRNAPPVLNSVFYRWFNWGGRFDSPWSLALGAAEKPEVMNGSRVAIARVIYAKYRAEYDALFPAPLDPILGAPPGPRLPADGKPKPPGAPDGAWEAMAPEDRTMIDRVFSDAGKAVAAYMRTLVARDAPFDRYVAGDPTAISARAKRGLRLFLAHCASCHGGPHFSDDKFHALGIAQFGDGVPADDLGRFADLPPLLASPFRGDGAHSDAPGAQLAGLRREPSQRGQFRTPSLRNVAVTGPYMHAGQLPTLEAVVAFYNVGGGRVDGVTKSDQMKPLGLSEEDQADLVAFMQSLTDLAVPAERLVDTSR
ncbi:MAG TPA: cytochrome c peroxidase [Kofleriaceae bacterium]|nr:cytochrome c peroxidase [Kofleriaceae bacterium]